MKYVNAREKFANLVKIYVCIIGGEGGALSKRTYFRGVYRPSLRSVTRGGRSKNSVTYFMDSP